MKRIFFVDDERDRIDAHRAALIAAGYDVVSCSSADDAVDQYAALEKGNIEPPYDLVIQDMMMPMPECTVAPGVIAGTHKVGAFFLSLLRAWNNQIPIIVFTQVPIDEPRGVIDILWDCFRDRQRKINRAFEDAASNITRIRTLQQEFRAYVWRKGDYANVHTFVSAVKSIIPP